LVQAGERDVDLRLHTERTEHLHVICTLDGGVQQCALADAGLAANDKRAAAPLSRRVDHLVDPRGLTLAAQEHCGEERTPESARRPRDFPGASAGLPCADWAHSDEADHLLLAVPRTRVLNRC
jgi:hypothetical protein